MKENFSLPRWKRISVYLVEREFQCTSMQENFSLPRFEFPWWINLPRVFQFTRNAFSLPELGFQFAPMKIRISVYPKEGFDPISVYSGPRSQIKHLGVVNWNSAYNVVSWNALWIGGKLIFSWMVNRNSSCSGGITLGKLKLTLG